MQVICLSGPERTRAQAEVALEARHIPYLPSDHHAQMDWPRKLTPLASGQEPKEPQSFLCVVAEDVNAPVTAVAPFEWVLRVHYPMPDEPKPDQMVELLKNIDRRLSALEAKVH